MRKLSPVLILLMAFGCGGSDISEDPPIDTDGIDASANQPDADPGAPDADTTQPDADPGAPDASQNRAQTFCDRYETLCGYDSGNSNRFDDESTCLTAFGGFDADQQTCVEGQLDELENDANLVHCGRAMGAGPCN